MSIRSKLFFFLPALLLLAVVGCSKNMVEDDQRRETIDFILKDLEGEEFQLSETQGDVVVLEFFDPFCHACQEEAKSGVLNTFYAEYDSVQVVGVAPPSRSKKEVKAFKEKYNLKYPLLLDTAGVWQAYRVRRTPTKFIIDKEGWIDGRVLIGTSTKEQLEDIIKPLLDAE